MLAYAFVYFYLQKQHQKTSIFSIKKNLILISALCPRPVHRGSWCLTLFRVRKCFDAAYADRRKYRQTSYYVIVAKLSEKRITLVCCFSQREVVGIYRRGVLHLILSYTYLMLLYMYYGVNFIAETNIMTIACQCGLNLITTRFIIQ